MNSWDETGSGAETPLKAPLGILGGGQLARMTIEAASALGIDVVIAERSSGSPASRVASREIVFPNGWDDDDAIARLSASAPTVTLESEFVDASVLDRLRALGCAVWTSPESLRTVQDKLTQKQALSAAGIGVAPFRAIESREDIADAGCELGWPLLLKARRDGYDGYGNARASDVESAARACESLGWPQRSVMAEALVEFTRELAVIVARGIDGQEVVYPVVETQQDPERHICKVVLAPAPVGIDVAANASRVALAAVRAVGGVGTFGVEMFETADGGVLVNELAPRPHNSGHYTIEACETSQFANHARAVLGLPLGSVEMRRPAAVMVNLLGAGDGLAGQESITGALSVPGAHLHLYGKTESRLGRKMGHVTALGSSLDEALERASLAASRIRT